MSDSSHSDTRSAADIEADVEQTRARVTQTIDALRDSMSPGQIMDQVVDYARGSGGAEFVRNLGTSVRDNPLPVLLIGAGIGWMLLGSQNRTAPHQQAVPLQPQRALPPPSPSTRMHVVHQASGPGITDRVSDATASLRDGAEGVASSVGSAIGSAASSARDALGAAASAASDAASSMAGAASGMAGSVGDALGSANDTARAYRHDATHMAGQGWNSAMGSASQYGGQMSHGLNRMASEQPLLLGALGLAVGAALGALLPRTQTEDRLMGDASDAMTSQLGGMAQEQYEQAKEVVTDRVQEVRSKLSGSAPSASSLGDTVADVARGVRETVTDAARDLGDTAKSGIDKGAAQAGLEKQDKTDDKAARI
ncbi:DUF3618 domain-containing protein [Roseomonas marmotae]|uniref:DUF3618 domain-containing protein n=1 Tax=Roseomonas marmotae TaxID=2768161 RepID=A0ABS3K7B2_9PROT|nr:DUF3618 domain-containing protein [Roseomonas marmotae]MBO1073320.1 DUF3618 domain-containing protein [Roseomonas marmotae]QTI79063.1 DUF3618 domain-containing protein [Roseomonas marmotae]